MKSARAFSSMLWGLILTATMILPVIAQNRQADIRRLRGINVGGSDLPPAYRDDDDDSSLPFLLDPSELKRLRIAPRSQMVKLVDLSKFMRPQPVYKVRIRAIRTANDGQTQAATITPAEIKKLVDQANMVWWSSGIEFLFDPAKDFEHRNSTLLNQDCSLANFGQHISDPNWDPATVDKEPNKAERTKVAKQYPGKLVVFFRYGTKFKWDDAIKSWKVGPATGGFSSSQSEYVAMTRKMPEKNLLAHEIGHYMHCPHTFGYRPATMAEASQAIKDWVEKKKHTTQQGDEVFDGDSKMVNSSLTFPVEDTAPDPGGGLFDAVYGEDGRCGPTTAVYVPVVFSGGYQAEYVIKPDRLNIMSYFKGCHNLGLHHLSKDQIANARDALKNGNRKHLISQ